MTDNEIIKALECCIDFVSGGESMCNNCPLYDCDNCSSEQLKQALGLINRQKTENSKLQRKNAELQYENLQMIASIKKIKSEAKKEFAERLCEGRVSNDPVVIAVKVELEEMTVTEKRMRGNEQKRALRP